MLSAQLFSSHQESASESWCLGGRSRARIANAAVNRIGPALPTLPVGANRLVTQLLDLRPPWDFSAKEETETEKLASEKATKEQLEFELEAHQELGEQEPPQVSGLQEQQHCV
ncbi:hypothetical protein NADE_000933 [Nannochloris sp. 'desiccata']|nr:hypothetical protein NADE_000933 [Chlorella desiccata (nom. nud.)]